MTKKSFLWMILAVFAVTLVGVPADAKFITMSGRAVMGYYASDGGGQYDTTTFRVPDVKLVSTFDMPAELKATFRMNLNEGEFGSVDYAFLDVPLGFVGLEDIKARVGQFKIPVGVETFIDNSVEQNLVNNSAGLFNGNDRGIMLMGKADFSDYGLIYEVAVTEGTAHNSVSAITGATSAGDDPDLDNDKALTARIGTKLTDALSVWGSWYRSGDIGPNGSASAAVGGVTTMAGSSKSWDRKLWMFHAEYKFEDGLIKGYFGQFDDDSSATGGTTEKREGDVWMAEGRYDFTDKVYLSVQHSQVDLDGSKTMAFGGGTGGYSLACNELKRTEAGIAYRLGEWVTFKYAWTNNKREFSSSQTGAGVKDTDDDQHSFIAAVKF